MPHSTKESNAAKLRGASAERKKQTHTKLTERCLGAHTQECTQRVNPHFTTTPPRAHTPSRNQHVAPSLPTCSTRIPPRPPLHPPSQLILHIGAAADTPSSAISPIPFRQGGLPCIPTLCTAAHQSASTHDPSSSTPHGLSTMSPADRLLLARSSLGRIHHLAHHPQTPVHPTPPHRTISAGTPASAASPRVPSTPIRHKGTSTIPTPATQEHHHQRLTAAAQRDPRVSSMPPRSFASTTPTISRLQLNVAR